MSQPSNLTYFIGGPWDLHKVAALEVQHGGYYKVAVVPKLELHPNLRDVNEELKTSIHTYHIKRQADNLFIAISEELLW